MTGYTVHTGSNDNFREGWDQIFSGGKKKKTSKGSKTGRKRRPRRKRKPAVRPRRNDSHRHRATRTGPVQSSVARLEQAVADGRIDPEVAGRIRRWLTDPALGEFSGAVAALLDADGHRRVGPAVSGKTSRSAPGAGGG
ncbi:MAG: hypothetical protein Ct9H300mP1_14770 [Planctomycetaceae bacterium]|nr:MAG: hypothetical protein Ct9H300mP1_14770 [Planctomycetaceae bacterium]